MPNHEVSLDLCFSALADPTRRSIIQRLAHGEVAVKELAAPHDMALPSFMEHLKKLEAANLITSKKEGRTRICSLAPNALAPANDWLVKQEYIWEGRLDRFDDHVNKLMQERDE